MTRFTILKGFSLVFCLWLLTTSAGLGQALNARLDGTVRDQTEAIIPGVEVAATNQGTNLTLQAVTNERGVFVFSNLRPGIYTISAELPGFRRYVETDLKLDVGATVTLDIQLQTGEVSEEITVSSTVPTVDRVSQSIGSVINQAQIENLPLVERNPMDLFFLVAGANRQFQNDVRGGRVDGLRQASSNVQVEGVSAGNPFDTLGATDSVVPLVVEAMAEYKVVASSASAENGQGSGAQVQLVFKSGTNDFHGSVFEFHRNKALNANSFFNNRQGIDKPTLIRHQYGFSAGGPVIRDRAFFHFTFEKITQKTDTTVNNTVYTDEFKNSGIFRFRDTNTGEIRELDLKTIDPTRTGISPLFNQFAGELPSPNNTDLGDGLNTAGFRFASDDPLEDRRFVLKGDYAFNDSHRISAVYADRDLDDATERTIRGIRRDLFEQTNPSGIITLSSNFSSSFLNEFRVAGTGQKSATLNGDDTRQTQIPHLNFNGLGGVSRGLNANRSNRLPLTTQTATITFNDNVTWIRGNHTLKGGVDIRIHRSNNTFGGDSFIPTAETDIGSNPAFIPSIPGLSGSDASRAQQLTNDLTASLGQFRQDFVDLTADGSQFVPFRNKFREWRQREYSFFFQDTWKFRPNLTLQLGLRYEVFPAAFDNEGLFGYPVDASGQPLIEGVFGVSGPAGPTFLGNPFRPGSGNSLYDTDWNNFAPNLGFTWDPTGSGKWSVAGNYRVAYDRNPLINTMFVDFDQIGSQIQVRIFGEPGDTLAGASALPDAAFQLAGTPFGEKAFDRNGTVSVWDDSYGTPYAQSWSLRIQREIFQNTVLEIAYVGNHAVGQIRGRDINEINVRDNGFLDGFLAAQQNLAASGDPTSGLDTGVFGQLWSVMTPGDRNSQLAAISRGEVGAVADFIDRVRVTRDYLGLAGLPNTFFRLNPQVWAAMINGNNSHSNYHGLKFDLRKRFSDGLQFQANYTFSKALTDFEGSQNNRTAFRDPDNEGLDRGRASIDVTHVWNANAIYELPFGRGRRWANFTNPILDGFLGGWQINGILGYSSGQPLTIISGRKTLTAPRFGATGFGATSTVNFLGDDPTFTADVKSVGGVITAITEDEKALFANPEAGNAGTSALRFFSGPTFWVLDGSLFKNFRTPWISGENANLQLRFEFFNLTNSTRFNNFNTNLASGAFGRISTARDARIIQAALKFTF